MTWRYAMKPSVVLLTVAAAVLGAASAGAQNTAHAIAMHGSPKYGPGATAFEYVNPAAPKGGKVVLSAIGTYDSLNPFILKGQSATGIGLLFETLLASSSDEAFTEYGLLAESVQWPDDRSWVAFTLRSDARWHDGRPVTVDDVIWTFETLKTKGHPFYRSYYKSVERARAVGPRTVRFDFGGGENRELPLIIGQMPVLPKHYWSTRDFEATTLDPPVGSGPYRVKTLDAGRSITYELDPGYWGRNLLVTRGQNNFQEIRYDYYRDRAVEREAFKAGSIDFFSENTAKDWATGYDLPAVKSGLIVKESISNENPQGMQAFVYNTRKPMFRDPRVRQAIGYVFDFEWTNQNLFYGQYTRTKSYFANSELASSGLPGKDELAILGRYRGRIPEEVFTTAYEPPATDGRGDLRGNLRSALRLLAAAGWTVKDGKLTQAGTGDAMSFEILLVSPAFERIVLPFAKNLEKLGIEARVNTVDTAQYQNRLDSFDFDVVITTWGQSLSPGNEQRDFWSVEAAATPGSRNLAGIEDPVIDELIELVIAAPDRESLIVRTRALDRVLLWSHYVTPQWHISAYRVLYWDKFGKPAVMPKYSLGLFGWWIDANKARTLEERRKAVLR